MKNRGQISVEYLLIIGILLLALIPLIYYATREANFSATQGVTDDVVKTIAAAADEVYALGPGSRKIVEVNMPKGVLGQSVGCECPEEFEKKLLKIIINTPSGPADIFAVTKSEIKGGIPITSGKKRIEVVALEDHVLIGQDTFPPVVISTAPTGTIGDSSPLLVAITDESAECKFLQGDINFDYSTEGTLMSGSGTTHTVQLTNLGEGSYTYSVKCRDFVDPIPNVMTTNALIQFTIAFVSGDNIAPEIVLLSPVNDFLENTTSIIRFKYQTCDPTFVDCTDPSEISSCKLEITQTGGGQVITIDDNDVTEDMTEQLTISLGDGEYFWKVKCTDTSANANVGESETRKVTVDLSGGGGGEIIGALADLGIDSGFYYKTNGAGLSTTDAGMASTNDITLDLLDDDKNTPPATSVLRYRTGDKYEGFWVELSNEEASNSDKVVLYGRVSVIDLDPFNLTVHGYQSDKTTPDLSTIVTFSVTDITGDPVKWVELDITDVARLEDGYGWMKFRVTSTNTGTQNSKRFQFSELHIKVGNYV